MGEVLALILLGAIVGTLIGGLGGGGGVIAVPMFIWFAGMSPSAAGTLSLIAVAAAATVAVILGIIAREIQWRWALAFGCIGLVGAFAGSALASTVDEMIILVAFGGVVVVATVRYIVGLIRAGSAVSEGPPRRGMAALTALVIGAVTGLVGVGGGFLIAPALMRIVRMAPRLAIATSSTIILFNCLSSLGARVVWGISVEPSVLLPVLIGSVVGGLAGKLLSRRASEATLHYASGGLLVVCCVAVGASMVQAAWT